MDIPVNGDADDDVAGEEEAEDPDEGAESTHQVSGPPRHRHGPSDLQRHHQKCHLIKKN